MTAVLTTLASFDSTNGASPFGGLVADASGNLFGTTYYGGTYGEGTVFELVNNNDGTYTVNTLDNFIFNYTSGSFPRGGLFADASGNLFGTAEYGGTNDGGTVFELVNNAGTYSTPNTLASFNGSTGYSPLGSLIADAKGDLFGVAQLGGENVWPAGAGTVFELVNNNDGTYTVKTLFAFNGSNGYSPIDISGLVADASGNLFGTTFNGGNGYGTNGDGTVFELVNNNGTYSLNTLVTFNGSNGAFPYSGLMADANGDLFGTTEAGGNGYGTVFELVNNSGNYALNTLFAFSGSDGASPFGGLVADASGNLFGTTEGGGTNGGFGTVFEITNSGFVVAPPDHWTNTQGGNWSAAGNWNPGVPTAKLNAEVDAPGTYSVAITKSAIAYGLLLNDAGATVTDNSGPLTLAGSGGAANPNGALTIDAGTFVLNGGGLDAGTIFIGSGGTLQISKGTYTNSNALLETITDNGSLIDTTRATITGNVSGTGTISAANSANLTIAGSLTGSENFTLANSAQVFIANDVSGTGSFTIANSAVLEFGTANNENITFASGSKGTVKFDQPLTQAFTAFGGTISGFSTTQKTTIDLADLSFVSGKMSASATYDSSSSTSTLIVSNGTDSVSLKLSGNYANSKWTLSQDKATGTLVVDPPAPTSTNNGPPGLDHVVALFTQSIAGFSDQPQNGVLNTNPLSQVVTNQEQFLANPHHG
jgi:hypothetical protein